MLKEQEPTAAELINHELACALFHAQYVLLDDNAIFEAQNRIREATGQDLLTKPDPEKFPSVSLGFSLEQAMNIRNRAITERASVQEIVRGILDTATLNEEEVPQVVDDLETGTVIEVTFDKAVLGFYAIIAEQREVSTEALLTNTVANFIAQDPIQ